MLKDQTSAVNLSIDDLRSIASLAISIDRRMIYSPLVPLVIHQHIETGELSLGETIKPPYLRRVGSLCALPLEDMAERLADLYLAIKVEWQTHTSLTLVERMQQRLGVGCIDLDRRLTVAETFDTAPHALIEKVAATHSRAEIRLRIESSHLIENEQMMDVVVEHYRLHGFTKEEKECHSEILNRDDVLFLVNSDARNMVSIDPGASTNANYDYLLTISLV